MNNKRNARNNMKKITLVLLLLLAVTSSTTAQQLFIEAGKTLSTFAYKNSQGSSLENLQASTHSFMAIGYRKGFLTKKLSLSLGANYTGYGAIGSDTMLGNFMEWDVNYAGLTVGFDYKLFAIKKATFYIKVGTSYAILVQGVQTHNNNVIDLKNKEDFDTILFTNQVGTAVSYPVSESLSVYAEYLYGESIDTGSGLSKLKIRSNNLGFGLLFDISKK
jgi:hypothetical protein